MSDEVIEANEVVEAIEVIEVAEVITPVKSPLRSSVPSRFLYSALLRCFEERKKWGRIRKYHVEVLHPFCQRLLRPAYVTFLKTD